MSGSNWVVPVATELLSRHQHGKCQLNGEQRVQNAGKGGLSQHVVRFEAYY